MSKLHLGIFGPGLSGKTSLAKRIAALCFNNNGIRSLVLDIHNEKWPEGCTVFTDEKKFWAAVWINRSHLIICDEATDTISRDKDLVPAFTRIRHLGHKLLVIGHDANSLLPTMRKQLTTLYLFRQDIDSCKVWARLFSDDDIFQAVKLNQYEFLECQLWGDGKNHARANKKMLTV